MPILVCAMHAEEGILRSGVAVETMIKSMSFGSSPAEAIASSPARAARSDVYSSGSAMCRSRIPKVSTHPLRRGWQVCHYFFVGQNLGRNVRTGGFDADTIKVAVSDFSFPLQSREQKDDRGGGFTTRIQGT